MARIDQHVLEVNAMVSTGRFEQAVNDFAQGQRRLSMRDFSEATYHIDRAHTNH